MSEKYTVEDARRWLHHMTSVCGALERLVADLEEHSGQGIGALYPEAGGPDFGCNPLFIQQIKGDCNNETFFPDPPRGMTFVGKVSIARALHRMRNICEALEEGLVAGPVPPDGEPNA